MLKEPLLQIKNISKSFILEKSFFGKSLKTLRAVNDISLDIFPGECLTIVGESGCGKSTLAKLILRLVEADQGEVIFEGKNFFDLYGEELTKKRRDLQMVFQNPFNSLDPRYKIFDAIAEPLEVHEAGKSKAEIEERVFELLDLVELNKDIAYKYPHECSGGQNQRACIARALALNPKFLIADEAVSALDVSTQWKILQLLKKLQSELGISMLFIAHNLGVVKYIADRVAVMYLGEVVELTTRDEIFKNPLHPYTKALFNSAPVADPRERNREKFHLKGEIPKPTQIPSGCPFHTRCPIAEAKCSEIKPELAQKKSAGSVDHVASCLLVE